MKNMKYIPLGIALVCVMLVTACNDIIESGYGRISISLTGEEVARTVFPSIVFNKYVYTFTKTGETAGVEISPDNGGLFTLEVGSYTVAVQAYAGTAEPYTLAASGVSEPFSVGPGSNNNPVRVSLSGINTAAQGEFSYTITYPTGATAEITLQKWPGLNDITLNPVNVTQGNGKTQTLPLEAGSYLLTVLISKNDFCAGISEAVHIYSSVTAVYTKDFEDDDLRLAQCTVTFDANGATSGMIPNAQTVGVGANIPLPNGSGLSKTVYAFGGWNTKADGTGILYIAGSSYPVSGNVTLYVYWVKAEYAWYAVNPNAASFTISTAAEFAAFAKIVNGTAVADGITAFSFSGRTITLVANIDLNNEPWTSIGTCISFDNPNNRPFLGIFDGNSKTITGLYINASGSNYQGLFGYTYTSSGNNNGAIKNLAVSGSVTGGSYVGGIVGFNGYATVQNCSFSGNVTGSGMYVGGVVGMNFSGFSVTGCYFNGNVTGNGNGSVGGVVGENDSGYIERSYSTGSVTGTGTNIVNTTGIGGVVGQNILGSVYNCYSTSNVTFSGSVGSTSLLVYVGVGGVVGFHQGGDSGSQLLRNCYATGDISGDGTRIVVGGVVGRTYSSEVENCVALNTSIGIDPSVRCVIGSIGTATTSRNNHCLSGAGISVTNGTPISEQNAANSTWWTDAGNWYSTSAWNFTSIWIWDSATNRPRLR
jgi:hypothetical protein